MKLVNVEYTFDNSKILFYFTADGRVDFRALVKDLASVFRTRIELRQIGVRDEAKMLGGLGICGKPFCCASFMGEFQPVSIKMAKEQGLSLSPVKISGTCGRLMCCLKYEQEAYTDLLKHTPKVGAIVNTPEGRGLVVENNLIAGTLKVKLNNTPEDAAPKSFTVKQCKLVKDGYIKLDKRKWKNSRDLNNFCNVYSVRQVAVKRTVFSLKYKILFQKVAFFKIYVTIKVKFMKEVFHGIYYQ